jgi:hypothetical protein
MLLEYQSVRQGFSFSDLKGAEPAKVGALVQPYACISMAFFFFELFWCGAGWTVKALV